MGVATLLCISVIFGSNHVAARFAFEHGSNVVTAVTFRAIFAFLFVLVLMRANGVSFALPGATRGRGMVIGLCLALQSFCVFSAVARIPVALALLAFNTYPMVIALVAWVLDGERPTRRTLVAMPVALAGLALALDVGGWSGAGARSFSGRWDEIGVGVSHVSRLPRLKDVDGRLRTLLATGTIAAVALAGGTLSGAFVLPADSTGWVALLLVGLFYSCGVTALFVVLPKIGVVNNSAALNFEPVAVLVMGWVLLGQAMAPLQIFGALVVIGAIVALSTGKR